MHNNQIYLEKEVEGLHTSQSQNFLQNYNNPGVPRWLSGLKACLQLRL